MYRNRKRKRKIFEREKKPKSNLLHGLGDMNDDDIDTNRMSVWLMILCLRDHFNKNKFIFSTTQRF